jgi:uncharacterized protein
MAEDDSTYRPPELAPQRVAACIGLISDTHMPDRCEALPPGVFDVLRGVDMLLHAGDVGELQVLDQLSAIAPVVAVHGNDDTAEAQRELPYQQIITVAGVRIVLSHCHFPDRATELASRQTDSWETKLAHRAAFGTRAGAPIVVFGHTHIPMVEHYADVLLINPGAIASGNIYSRQTIQSVALLYIRDDGLPFVTHVDLANPRRPFTPQIDREAGFKAALDAYSEPILDPALMAIRGRLFSIPGITSEPARAVLRRIALPYLSTVRAIITPQSLLAELRREPELPSAILVAIEEMLEPLTAPSDRE